MHPSFVAGFLIALCLLGSAPAPVWAQVPVVGHLFMGAPQQGGPVFLQHMPALGHREGRTFVLESRWSADDSRFPALARELLDRRPAVIHSACGSALRAIRELSRTVPVIAGCVDPRNFLGEVASLSRPGGLTTGYTFLAPESAGKRLQLLKELIPTLSRVGVLYDIHNNWETYLQEMERAAPHLGLVFSRHVVERAEDLEGAFSTAVGKRAEALVVFPTPVNFGARKRIAALAVKHKLPTAFDTRSFVADGGLLSYGPDWFDPDFAPRVIATYIDKILKGTSAGDLPIQQPTRLELVVNLQTAHMLGLSLSRSFLDRADTVFK
jgi:putative ABC transport system substrate-binding protein